MKLQRNGIVVRVDFTEANPQKMAELRLERNMRLMACDWTQIPGAPISVEQKSAWDVYRQKLRDLPSVVDPDKLPEVVWPVAPV